jgi:hypothetical protein
MTDTISDPADASVTAIVEAARLSSLPLAALMSQLREADLKIKRLNDKLKDAKAEKGVLEDAIIAKLEEQGTDSGRVNGLGTVSIRQSVVPNVKNWDDFYGFIKENDYFHLLERRPSAPGCRELFERYGAIPGVEPFNKRTLGFTAA